MIAESNALETIAEIAATIAGLAALASVLGDNHKSKDQRFVQLRVVVSNGLLMTFCALIPVICQHMGFSTESMWRMSAAIALPVTWIAVYQNFGLTRSTGISARRKGNYLRLATLPVGQLCLFAVAAGFFADIAGSLYLVFLFVSLAAVALTFLNFLDELFSRSP